MNNESRRVLSQRARREISPSNSASISSLEQLKTSAIDQIGLNVHVVIAGNSVEFPCKLLTGQHMASKDQSTLYEPIKELDIMLTQIAAEAEVSVDLMPGRNDPANLA
ncbi:hypothetical protein Bca52824_011124 [Brassica carinata]|uniref:DNA polymerase alpha/delta/epsilon subunit B domain-containing protein n=1 Tax=Brassica carinata TaxID=52824 RepID=A0A8X7WE24_BRACI|nr:hypothetical protein Bca52824_011124 [Brassica carinata]